MTKKIDLADLVILRNSEENANKERIRTGIIKVSEENYVPKEVKVRTWISPFLATVELKDDFEGNFEDLTDPKIIYIEPHRKLNLL